MSEIDSLDHPKLIKWPHPILSKESEYVNLGHISPAQMLNIFDLIIDMNEVMDHFDETNQDGYISVGIAAPQVGKLVRLIIMRMRGEETLMFNPRISKRSPQTYNEKETCLSVDFPVLVRRHKQITVVWDDIDGKQMHKKYRGDESRVIQHEIDHLDGITLASRLESGTGVGLDN